MQWNTIKVNVVVKSILLFKQYIKNRVDFMSRDNDRAMLQIRERMSFSKLHLRLPRITCRRLLKDPTDARHALTSILPIWQ